MSPFPPSMVHLASGPISSRKIGVLGPPVHSGTGVAWWCGFTASAASSRVATTSTSSSATSTATDRGHLRLGVGDGGLGLVQGRCSDRRNGWRLVSLEDVVSMGNDFLEGLFI